MTATEGNDGIVVSSLLRDTGMVTVDPGFMNTASCESQITYIDGDEGILRYRGYPIEQLAEHSTFLEVAYLLIHGALPTPSELDAFEERVNRHTLVHEDFRTFMGTFPRHAHPMAVMASAINALSTFYPESLDPFDPETVELATVLILAKTRTITSYVHRASKGEPLLYPDYSRGYVEDFLRMTFAVPYQQYEADPVVVSALDQLLILHADHEQNCSTSTVRIVGSSQANLYASVAAGINALSGPLHGGANEAVLKMLTEIQADGGDATELHEARQGQGARRPPHGLRAPRLQELRPPRGDREEERRLGARPPWAATTSCSTSRWASRRSRSPTSTSSPASCTRTSTSTRASSTRRWASPRRCSRRCSRWVACPAGSRSGAR